ncbi:MAG: 16S rRNA (cytidine(1402)-2'-O)-methyltransferase [Candidatus Kapabacteria bacterium]|nr:16S rRNA (cytidine(1402)-2'-O)-methyltransferase [Candidatus Kapabacteria bacterium]
MATPIGNLSDISFRAYHILKNVDLIACEDTRSSGILLKALNIIGKKLISYHDYNEDSRSDSIITELKAGKSVVLISDAGTPCISDPGYRLVHKAIESDIRVIPIPGASSILTALIASGLAIDSFIFLGFPPQKKGRQTFIRNCIKQDHTVIMLESVHRIMKLLEELCAAAGSDRKICIARELTKLHEEFIRGTIGECLITLKKRQQIKGEFVVVLEKVKNL